MHPEVIRAICRDEIKVAEVVFTNSNKHTYEKRCFSERYISSPRHLKENQKNRWIFK